MFMLFRLSRSQAYLNHILRLCPNSTCFVSCCWCLIDHDMRVVYCIFTILANVLDTLSKHYQHSTKAATSWYFFGGAKRLLHVFLTTKKFLAHSKCSWKFSGGGDCPVAHPLGCGPDQHVRSVLGNSTYRRQVLNTEYHVCKDHVSWLRARSAVFIWLIQWANTANMLPFCAWPETLPCCCFVERCPQWWLNHVQGLWKTSPARLEEDRWCKVENIRGAQCWKDKSKSRDTELCRNN